MEKSILKILVENVRRRKLLDTPYDPIAGKGCSGKRVKADASAWGEGEVMIPAEMAADPEFPAISSHDGWVKLRCRHDFEYWAAKCVRIRDKTTGKEVPFILNAPQRRVAAILEDDRRNSRPLRLIMLKARQWGGSTLIQMYMAWIQTCLRTNWHSLICAHVKDTAATIRGMYSKMLSRYPEEYWDGDKRPEFKPFERTANIRMIEGRGCRVTLGSSENQDAVRGSDYAMAHLSEVAFWKDTPQTSPEMFIRAICGAINYNPLTLIALESTANGIGNYFHREWLRSVAGLSDKHAVFVPWYEIEIYRIDTDDFDSLIEEMDDYERNLWDQGLTLQMIAWYHQKRREYPSLKQMQAEYPTNDTEAFTTVDSNVFSPDDVEPLRCNCMPPAETGEIHADSPTGAAALRNLRFIPNSSGMLKIWRHPAESDSRDYSPRYIVAVDIGGRSASSDWSVIAVLDRYGGADGATAEVVAQWRGHADHDILAWKSVQIARYWDNALLVFESNTLESEATDGDPSLFILNEVQRHYHRLYRRPAAEGNGFKIGFHTNRSTKTMIINRLIAVVREQAYIERDDNAVNEMLTYQVNLNGSFSAMGGCHDDILMTRAIALHVASSMPKPSPDPSLDSYLRRFR